MRIKLLFLLLLCSFGANAQIYHSFPTDSARWKFAYWEGNPMNPPGYTWERIMNGDTVINATTWSKVYDQYGALQYALREGNKQVSCYNFTSQAESVVFDYNLSLGDTFYRVSTPNNVSFAFVPDSFVVYDIDTIQINSVAHRQWMLQGIGDTSGLIVSESWIDGIGLIYTRTWLSGAGELICFFKNNQHYYSTFVSSSYQCFTGVEEEEAASCSISFDNASGQLSINAPGTDIRECRIYNSTGQLVYCVTRPGNTISMAGISPGLYIVQADLLNGTRVNKR